MGLILFYSKWNFLYRVELTLWTHFVAVQLQPDLLDRIPTSNTINSGSTELETTTPAGTEDEDTIKTTASDDAEITADENSTELVSSSKDDDDTTTDRDLNSLDKNSCVNGKWMDLVSCSNSNAFLKEFEIDVKCRWVKQNAKILIFKTFSKIQKKKNN